MDSAARTRENGGDDGNMGMDRVVPGGGADRCGDGGDPAPTPPVDHSAAKVDLLAPSASLLVKLGSALVHAQEMTEPGAHEFDLGSFKSLCADPEVVAWLEAMGALALLPVKRSA